MLCRIGEEPGIESAALNSAGRQVKKRVCPEELVSEAEASWRGPTGLVATELQPSGWRDARPSSSVSGLETGRFG